MGKQFAMDEFFGGKVDYQSQSHLACALLLDTSASMGMGARAIDSLNAGIKRFKAGLLSDPVAKKTVDVALVTFNSEVKVVSGFLPVSNMPTPELRASGRTDMAQGIQMAIDLVKDRTKQYQELGTPCHKPWIVMITDGLSTSSSFEMQEAAKRIQKEEEKGTHGRLSFWALGIGDYDSAEMFQLTKRVIELRDVDFSQFFDWLTDSLTCISNSNVDDRVSIPPMKDDMRKAREDRTIDEGWY